MEMSFKHATLHLDSGFRESSIMSIKCLALFLASWVPCKKRMLFMKKEFEHTKLILNPKVWKQNFSKRGSQEPRSKGKFG
jgi:hypothetical protein